MPESAWELVSMVAIKYGALGIIVVLFLVATCLGLMVWLKFGRKREPYEHGNGVGNGKIQGALIEAMRESNREFTQSIRDGFAELKTEMRAWRERNHAMADTLQATTGELHASRKVFERESEKLKK